MDYVWCQVFLIGYCWITQTKVKSVNVSMIFEGIAVERCVNGREIKNLVAKMRHILAEVENDECFSSSIQLRVQRFHELWNVDQSEAD